jgi:hypothetical protein
VSVSLQRLIKSTSLLVDSETISGTGSISNKANIFVEDNNRAIINNGNASAQWRVKNVPATALSLPAGADVTAWSLQINGLASGTYSVQSRLGLSLNNTATSNANHMLFPQFAFPTSRATTTFAEGTDALTTGATFSASNGTTMLGNKAAAWNDIAIWADLQPGILTDQQIEIYWVKLLVTYSVEGGAAFVLSYVF